MNIFVNHITQNLSHSEFERLAALVAREKRTKIQNYRSFSDAQRSLLGDVLARYAVCTTYNLLNTNLQFSENEFGKPFLQSHQNIRHNISHAGNYVVCAVSEAMQIGIDVETITSTDIEIAERFFTSDEYNYLQKQPPELQNDCFYKIWTMKESYIKMIGKGLSMPLNSFSVLNKNSTNGAYFLQFIKTADAVGHICSERTAEAHCVEISYTQLLEWASYMTSNKHYISGRG